MKRAPSTNKLQTAFDDALKLPFDGKMLEKDDIKLCRTNRDSIIGDTRTRLSRLAEMGATDFGVLASQIRYEIGVWLRSRLYREYIEYLKNCGGSGQESLTMGEFVKDHWAQERFEDLKKRKIGAGSRVRTTGTGPHYDGEFIVAKITRSIEVSIANDKGEIIAALAPGYLKRTDLVKSEKVG